MTAGPAEPVKFTVSERRLPAGDHEAGRSRLDQILARGLLRVGYLEDSLPYAFVNSEAELVGMDVDLANVMAREMGVGSRVRESVTCDSIAADLDCGALRPGDVGPGNQRQSACSG